MLREQTPPLNIHRDGSQNREKPNLSPLDSPSPKRKQKPKRIKLTRDEYKQVMSAFYQALNEPKNNNTKRTYEIWRKEVGENTDHILMRINWQMLDEI